jgi:hypothetical protein
MVLPITGPYTSGGYDSADNYRRQQRYAQKRPIDRPLPYSTLFGRRLTGPSASKPSSAVPSYVTISSSTEYNQALIHCYEKLKDAISDRSSMGENLIDLSQSVRTIETRALQLYRFTKAIKRGDFKSASHILRTPDPKVKHPVKQSANNWLEYHLGIEPVVKDIYSAVNFLQTPVKNVFIRQRAMSPYYRKTPDPALYQAQTEWGYRVNIQMIVEVAVSNPALWLANALGIINPAQVLWQVMPLSFVIDWFANVESFLGQTTDFWGLTTKNPLTTVSWRGTTTETWPNPKNYLPASAWQCGGQTRNLGLTLPSLGLRPFKLPGWQRGFTACALLTGGLKSLR